MRGPEFRKYIHNLNVPILDIGDKRGWTDYIDFIKESDMTAPVMKGVDVYGREFVALKVKSDNNNDNIPKLSVEVFFRRYSDSEKLWMEATSGKQLLYTIGGMTESDFDTVIKLIEGCRVIYPYNDNTNIEIYV